MMEEEDKEYYSYCNPPGEKWALLRFSSGHVFVNGVRVEGEETKVEEGDLVTTGNDGYCELNWPDAGVTVLGSNARFRVEDIHAGG
jgi:hypothetical protein